jgi:hypothetical protein
VVGRSAVSHPAELQQSSGDPSAPANWPGFTVVSGDPISSTMPAVLMSHLRGPLSGRSRGSATGPTRRCRSPTAGQPRRWFRDGRFGVVLDSDVGDGHRGNSHGYSLLEQLWGWTSARPIVRSPGPEISQHGSGWERESLSRRVLIGDPSCGGLPVRSQDGQPSRGPRVLDLAAGQDHSAAGGYARCRRAPCPGLASRRGRRSRGGQRGVLLEAGARRYRRGVCFRPRCHCPCSSARRRRAHPPVQSRPCCGRDQCRDEASSSSRETVDGAAESDLGAGQDHRAGHHPQRPDGSAGRQRPRSGHAHRCLRQRHGRAA